jgi:hypothetical protein
MTAIKRLASLALACTALATTMTHCAGNVASLRLLAASRSRIIVPVTINHGGPCDFLLGRVHTTLNASKISAK